MTNNLRKLAFALTATLALSLVLAPGATAQTGQSTPNFNLGTPSASSQSPLAPDTGLMTISVPWQYEISDAGFSFQTLAASSTTMTWKVPVCTGDNGGIVITGALTTLVSPSSPSGTDNGGKDSGDHDFTVQATQQAPGETPIRCEFKASVEGLGTQVTATAEKSTTTTIVVDYLGLISANVPGTIKQAGPQKEITYDIEVTNLGNSQSTVRFDLLTENVGKWDPVTPSEIILQATAQGGTEISKVVSFQVSTPFKNGWNNDQKTFQLRITPVSTKNIEKEGTPVTVNVLSRVRGVYVPTLEPMVMVGAVLGSALLVRNMRREE